MEFRRGFLDRRWRRQVGCLAHRHLPQGIAFRRNHIFKFKPVWGVQKRVTVSIPVPIGMRQIYRKVIAGHSCGQAGLCRGRVGSIVQKCRKYKGAEGPD